MRILVTGGAGLVGSSAALFWAGRGHEVTVLDNLARSGYLGAARESVEHNWRAVGLDGRVRMVQGDVRDQEALARALGQGVDVVLHAAAQPSVAFSTQRPLDDFQINAAGTLAVLESIRGRCPGAAVLYCSTNKVYGTNVDRPSIREGERRYAYAGAGTGVAESTPLDLAGRTPYGVSKLAGDLYVQEYARTYGLRTAVFRMSCTYGPRQFGYEDHGWVAHVALCTVLGRPLTIYGDGKQVRDVLYIDDLVEAFDRFIRGAALHGVFNIGGGPAHTTSLLELLDLLEQATGRRVSVSYQPWRLHDQKVYISDISAAERVLGWSPRVGLGEGVERMLAWIDANRGIF